MNNLILNQIISFKFKCQKKILKKANEEQEKKL